MKAELERGARNVSIVSGLSRWKYWYQDYASLSNTVDLTSSLVIHVHCSPYDWLSKMFLNPMFAPFHRPSQTHNSMSEFLRKKWSLPKSHWDKRNVAVGEKCQYKFPRKRVVPCLGGKRTGDQASKMYPVYEMDPFTNEAFENIVKFRVSDFSIIAKIEW